jgi:hypothetical protein
MLTKFHSVASRGPVGEGSAGMKRSRGTLAGAREGAHMDPRRRRFCHQSSPEGPASISGRVSGSPRPRPPEKSALATVPCAEHGRPSARPAPARPPALGLGRRRTSSRVARCVREQYEHVRAACARSKIPRLYATAQGVVIAPAHRSRQDARNSGQTRTSCGWCMEAFEKPSLSAARE